MKNMVIINNRSVDRVFYSFFLLGDEVAVINRQVGKGDRKLKAAIKDKSVTVVTATSRRVGGIDLFTCRHIHRPLSDPDKALQSYLRDEDDTSVSEEAKAEDEAKAKAKAKAEDEDEAKAKAKAKAEDEAKAKAKAKAEDEAKAKAKAKTSTKPKSKLKSEPEVEVSTDVIDEGEKRLLKFRKETQDLGKQEFKKYVKKNFPDIHFNSKTSKVSLAKDCESFIKSKVEASGAKSLL